MNTNTYPQPVLWRKSPLPHHATWWSSVSAEAAIEFGRFRVLLRRRRLLADGVPVELGTRAFDLLLVLLEADGALVTKEELLRRVWPGVVRLGREPEGSDLRVAQSTRRGAQFHPHGIRPRLPVHWHVARQCHCARLPRLQANKPAGLSSFASAELLAIAPVWFQFELVTETGTHGDVVTAKPVRIHGLNIRYSRAQTVSYRSKQ